MNRLMLWTLRTLATLAAGIGSTIDLTCSGRQGTEAMAALSALVESKFGEE